MAPKPLSKKENTRRLVSTFLLAFLALAAISMLRFSNELAPYSDKLGGWAVAAMDEPANRVLMSTLGILGFKEVSSADGRACSFRNPQKTGHFIFTGPTLWNSLHPTVLPILLLATAAGAVVSWKWRLSPLRSLLAVLAASVVLLTPFFAAVAHAVFLSGFLSDAEALHSLYYWHASTLAGTAVAILVLMGVWRTLRPADKSTKAPADALPTL